MGTDKRQQQNLNSSRMGDIYKNVIEKYVKGKGKVILITGLCGLEGG